MLVLPGYERFLSGPTRRSFVRAAVRRFPNGELHVEVPERVAGRRCVIVGSISPPAGNLERLTLVGHALRRAGAQRITALLPYLAYARQDRAGRTESLGLAWAGELSRASGIGEVVCVDLHSKRGAEVLGLGLTSLSPAGLRAGALPEPWRSQVTFVAPDEGTVDRCAAVALAVGVDRPVVWARKRRTPAGVEHLGLVGTPGRRAIVVDDILDTGDALVSCCRALRDSGVTDSAWSRPTACSPGTGGARCSPTACAGSGSRTRCSHGAAPRRHTSCPWRRCWHRSSTDAVAEEALMPETITPRLPGATHLFEEPGEMEELSQLAGERSERHLIRAAHLSA